MNVGQLRHVIEIQRFETITDEGGFNAEEWTTIASPRCKIEFDNRLMREVFRDDMVVSTGVLIFTFRYFKGLTTKDSILYDGKRYEIYGINNVNNVGQYYQVWGRVINP